MRPDPRANQGMTFTDIDIAYASGLFEGEGTVYATHHYYRNGEKRTRQTPQVKVQFSMTDREPLEKIMAIFGGRIHGPYSPSKYGHAEHCKDSWLFILDNQGKAREALDAMYPNLSPRRQAQIDAVLRRGESD